MKQFILVFIKCVLVLACILAGLVNVSLSWLTFANGGAILALPVAASIFFCAAIYGSWEKIKSIFRGE